MMKKILVALISLCSMSLLHAVEVEASDDAALSTQAVSNDVVEVQDDSLVFEVLQMLQVAPARWRFDHPLTDAATPLAAWSREYSAEDDSLAFLEAATKVAQHSGELVHYNKVFRAFTKDFQPKDIVSSGTQLQDIVATQIVELFETMESLGEKNNDLRIWHLLGDQRSFATAAAYACIMESSDEWSKIIVRELARAALEEEIDLIDLQPKVDDYTMVRIEEAVKEIKAFYDLPEIEEVWGSVESPQYSELVALLWLVMRANDMYQITVPLAKGPLRLLMEIIHREKDAGENDFDQFRMSKQLKEMALMDPIERKKMERTEVSAFDSHVAGRNRAVHRERWNLKEWKTPRNWKMPLTKLARSKFGRGMRRIKKREANQKDRYAKAILAASWDREKLAQQYAERDAANADVANSFQGQKAVHYPRWWLHPKRASFVRGKIQKSSRMGRLLMLSFIRAHNEWSRGLIAKFPPLHEGHYLEPAEPNWEAIVSKPQAFRGAVSIYLGAKQSHDENDELGFADHRASAYQMKWQRMSRQNKHQQMVVGNAINALHDLSDWLGFTPGRRTKMKDRHRQLRAWKAALKLARMALASLSIAGAAGAITPPLEGLATMVGIDITPDAMPDIVTGPDGVTTTTDADGTTTFNAPDGSTMVVDADGTTTITAPDGTVTVSDPVTNGPTNVTVTAPDGTVTATTTEVDGDISTITTTVTPADAEGATTTVTHIDGTTMTVTEYDGAVDPAHMTSQTVSHDGVVYETTIITRSDNVAVTRVYRGEVSAGDLRTTSVAVTSDTGTTTTLYNGGVTFGSDGTASGEVVSVTEAPTGDAHPTVTTTPQDNTTVVATHADGLDNDPTSIAVTTVDPAAGTETTQVFSGSPSTLQTTTVTTTDPDTGLQTTQVFDGAIEAGETPQTTTLTTTDPDTGAQTVQVFDGAIEEGEAPQTTTVIEVDSDAGTRTVSEFTNEITPGSEAHTTTVTTIDSETGTRTVEVFDGEIDAGEAPQRTIVHPSDGSAPHIITTEDGVQVTRVYAGPDGLDGGVTRTLRVPADGGPSTVTTTPEEGVTVVETYNDGLDADISSTSVHRVDPVTGDETVQFFNGTREPAEVPQTTTVTSVDSTTGVRTVSVFEGQIAGTETPQTTTITTTDPAAGTEVVEVFEGADTTPTSVTITTTDHDGTVTVEVFNGPTDAPDTLQSTTVTPGDGTSPPTVTTTAPDGATVVATHADGLESPATSTAVTVTDTDGTETIQVFDGVVESGKAPQSVTVIPGDGTTPPTVTTTPSDGVTVVATHADGLDSAARSTTVTTVDAGAGAETVQVFDGPYTGSETPVTTTVITTDASGVQTTQVFDGAIEVDEVPQSTTVVPSDGTTAPTVTTTAPDGATVVATHADGLENTATSTTVTATDADGTETIQVFDGVVESGEAPQSVTVIPGDGTTPPTVTTTPSDGVTVVATHADGLDSAATSTTVTTVDAGARTETVQVFDGPYTGSETPVTTTVTTTDGSGVQTTQVFDGAPEDGNVQSTTVIPGDGGAPTVTTTPTDNVVVEVTYADGLGNDPTSTMVTTTDTDTGTLTVEVFDGARDSGETPLTTTVTTTDAETGTTIQLFDGATGDGVAPRSVTHIPADGSAPTVTTTPAEGTTVVSTHGSDLSAPPTSTTITTVDPATGVETTQLFTGEATVGDTPVSTTITTTDGSGTQTIQTFAGAAEVGEAPQSITTVPGDGTAPTVTTTSPDGATVVTTYADGLESSATSTTVTVTDVDGTQTITAFDGLFTGSEVPQSTTTIPGDGGAPTVSTTPSDGVTVFEAYANGLDEDPTSTTVTTVNPPDGGPVTTTVATTDASGAQTIEVFDGVRRPDGAPQSVTVIPGDGGAPTVTTTPSDGVTVVATHADGLESPATSTQVTTIDLDSGTETIQVFEGSSASPESTTVIPGDGSPATETTFEGGAEVVRTYGADGPSGAIESTTVTRDTANGTVVTEYSGGEITAENITRETTTTVDGSTTIVVVKDGTGAVVETRVIVVDGATTTETTTAGTLEVTTVTDTSSGDVIRQTAIVTEGDTVQTTVVEGNTTTEILIAHDGTRTQTVSITQPDGSVSETVTITRPDGSGFIQHPDGTVEDIVTPDILPEGASDGGETD